LQVKPHLPLVHVAVALAGAVQDTQVPPPLPQAEGKVPAWQVPLEQQPVQHWCFESHFLPGAAHPTGAPLASLAPPRTDNAPASPNPKTLRAWRRVVVVASALVSSSNRLGSFDSIFVSPEIVFIRGMQ
jgi:hypothetical protein